MAMAHKAQSGRRWEADPARTLQAPGIQRSRCEKANWFICMNARLTKPIPSLASSGKLGSASGRNGSAEEKRVGGQEKRVGVSACRRVGEWETRVGGQEKRVGVSACRRVGEWETRVGGSAGRRVGEWGETGRRIGGSASGRRGSACRRVAFVFSHPRKLIRKLPRPPSSNTPICRHALPRPVFPTRRHADAPTRVSRSPTRPHADPPTRFSCPPTRVSRSPTRRHADTPTRFSPANPFLPLADPCPPLADPPTRRYADTCLPLADPFLPRRPVSPAVSCLAYRVERIRLGKQLCRISPKNSF